MITFLNGILVDKQPTRIEIEVGGVGYEVLIPLSSYDKLPACGSACRVLTYDHVREDQHQLYGFITADERNMFVLLISISGIGPKLAIGALSGLTVRDLRNAIIHGDAKRLSSISGVGKKMAERIALELRDKIDPADVLKSSSAGAEMTAEQVRVRDAILALISLGYKQDTAKRMVSDATSGVSVKDMSVEEIIRGSLSG
ncbi:MAG: Holliday junction branch migration protein RuvA [Lentisphaerae bacterium]|nr:Holliday junction branch migration protein RuvA [Lentisphaerota bacterium]